MVGKVTVSMLERNLLRLHENFGEGEEIGKKYRREPLEGPLKKLSFLFFEFSVPISLPSPLVLFRAGVAAG